jgi:hypothetical protein
MHQWLISGIHGLYLTAQQEFTRFTADERRQVTSFVTRLGAVPILADARRQMCEKTLRACRHTENSACRGNRFAILLSTRPTLCICMLSRDRLNTPSTSHCTASRCSPVQSTSQP